jgi:arginyl-tRNA synthetase
VSDKSRKIDPLFAGLEDLFSSLLETAAKDSDLKIPPNLKIDFQRTKNQDHGDIASNIALALAKENERQPREIAELLLKHLKSTQFKAALDEIGIDKFEVAGPGFINLFLAQQSRGQVINQVLGDLDNFGHSKLLNGQRVNLEFVSANPTGPLHLGHTRWAAVGDGMARVLRAAGATVSTEFYINDRGNQMDLFAQSIINAADNKPAPEDGYNGDYIKDLANQILARNPEFKKLTGEEAIAKFKNAGYQLQLAEQQQVLKDFRTNFDTWFSEESLYQNDFVKKVIEKYRTNGKVFTEEGAIWLRTTEFGDDKDRVLVKSDGAYAYFASDIAYYMSKRDRGFNLCIYLLGADHHGYLARLKAAAGCAGDDPDKNIKVLIGQMVKIMEGGSELKLSKRAGTIITLAELVEKVGVDAARYTLMRYPTDTPMVLDVDLLKKHTNDNPVYYVQYAHARICAMSRNAKELSVKSLSHPIADQYLDLLVHEREIDLLSALAKFPEVVASAAQLLQPHRICRYLEELAGIYHRFYNDCRVLPVGEEKVSEVHQIRVTLSLATAQVIKNGLTLIGVDAPERM